MLFDLKPDAVEVVKTTEANLQKSETNSANARLANEGNNGESDIFVNVFPNPTTGLFYWKLLSNEPSTVNLTMFNSMGKETMNQSSATITQTHEGTIDMSKIDMGVYFLRFMVGQKSLVRKVVKN